MTVSMVCTNLLNTKSFSFFSIFFHFFSIFTYLFKTIFSQFLFLCQFPLHSFLSLPCLPPSPAPHLLLRESKASYGESTKSLAHHLEAGPRLIPCIWAEKGIPHEEHFTPLFYNIYSTQ